MSELAVTPVSRPKARAKLVILIVSSAMPLLLYGAGIVALPVLVLGNYQDRNCDSVLSIHSFYTVLYPKFIEDGSLSAPVNECRAYVLAGDKQEAAEWRAAYDAYQSYLITYPDGMYAQEAHTSSAVVLMGLATQQVEQKKYGEAVENLTQITLSYSDTETNDVAWGMFPSVYTAWGTGLREAGDFEGAERVLRDFKLWSQQNLRPESETDASRELAQTYLDWGQQLQSENQFEDALAKYDLAISVDPDSKFDSAAEVQAGQRQAYVGWGNALLEQADFPTAIQQFELAVSHSEGKNEDGVNDALANGYMQWARDLTSHEDFLGALEQLKAAQKAAMADSVKKSVDVALQDTYLAFSNSTGKQAQQAMLEALELACKKHKTPSLPIFGLNRDSIHVGVYGMETKLPENLAATTPGEMHYVACIVEDNKTVESRWHINILLRVAKGYFYERFQQFRTQIVWNIRVVKLDTLDDVAETTLLGGTPPPFPEGNYSSAAYVYGPPPTIEEFSEWLQSVIK